MSYVEGTSRSQIMLLPEVIDDYITAENPVRFIDAFVEGLNPKELGFKNAIAKTTGPSIQPSRFIASLYIWLPESDTIQPITGEGNSSQSGSNMVNEEIKT